MDRNSLIKKFEQEQERFVDEWKTFLRFKSISTDPAYGAECRSCAEWLVDNFTRLGFKAELRETNGKPLVLATRPGAADLPRVLIYGHYDVQPVDPLSEWQSQPFEPELRNGRLYARGAQDNKGQLLYILKAIEHLIEEQALHCPLTILIEGEEESSSEGLTLALPQLADEIRSDVLLVCDTGGFSIDRPCITMSLRGCLGLEVRLSGPLQDLHSGVHGGVVKNPAVELARMVAELHHADGSISVPDFYAGVSEVSKEMLDLVNRDSYTPEQYQGLVGVPPEGGEQGLSFNHRRGLRPCIDLNGIHSGYDGPGCKNIIPAQAMAKVSARLVLGQDPERCLALIKKHFEDRLPRGFRISFPYEVVNGPALMLNSESPLVARATRVLKNVSAGEPQFLWEGASIPVLSVLTQYSGAEPLLIGFGLEEDGIHAPNESFSIDQLRAGFVYAALMLRDLSGG